MRRLIATVASSRTAAIVRLVSGPPVNWVGSAIMAPKIVMVTAPPTRRKVLNGEEGRGTAEATTRRAKVRPDQVELSTGAPCLPPRSS